MKNDKLTRREAIKKTVGVGLSTGAVMGAPQWILPALAQGEEQYRSVICRKDIAEDRLDLGHLIG